MMKIKLLALVLGLLLVFGCVMENKTDANNVINMTKKNDTKKPATTNVSKEIVVLETNKGTIEIELNREKSPITVENFVKYVKMGFYDGTIFHRVIPRFMIQGGGFNQFKREKSAGAPIKLESTNGLKNLKGTVAMARTNNPNSATAQFFVNTVDNDFLNYKPGNDGYAVFGKIISGMDVVVAIESVKTGIYGDYENWPTEEVVITRAYMK